MHKNNSWSACHTVPCMSLSRQLAQVTEEEPDHFLTEMSDFNIPEEVFPWCQLWRCCPFHVPVLESWATSWPEEEGRNPPMSKVHKVEENLLSNRGKPYWTVLGRCGGRPGEMQNIQLEKVVIEAAGFRELLILVQLLLIMKTQAAVQKLWDCYQQSQKPRKTRKGATQL